MKVLGVHSLTHDIGAALSINGKITAAVEEERLSREKHQSGIEEEGSEPLNSINWVLSEAGIALNDIDLFVHIGWPGNDFMRLDIIRDRFRRFTRSFDPQGNRTLFVDHHKAHAASAFYASGFEESLVIAIDGQGDWISTSLYIGRDRKLKKIDEYFVDQSLGFMYSRAAKTLGLGGFGCGEGKMVGLAAYGNPLIDFPPPVVIEGERYRIVDNYFEKTFKQFQLGNENLTDIHKDFAATIQTYLESTLCSIVSAAAARYNQKNLAMAGGVALNCKMNEKIAKLPCIESMYVQPAANDGGLCIGAAYLGALSVGDIPQPISSIFLGPKLDDPEIVIKKNKLSANYVNNPAEVAAEAISKNNTVAWMQDRLEFGPRALGNRSLLGDPRSVECRDQLNTIKEREGWRPIAPAVCSDGEKYCDLDKNVTYKFMTHTVKMTKIAQKVIPAAVHVDGTARVQIVDKEHASFYSLLKAFERLSGVGAVLNTSLNRQGEPLCCSVEDGIRFFYTTPTDILIMGNWIVTK